MRTPMKNRIDNLFARVAGKEPRGTSCVVQHQGPRMPAVNGLPARANVVGLGNEYLMH